MADETPVTATVGNDGLTPSVLGSMEEWLAFNASIRRAGERKGYLSFMSTGGLERGRDDAPCSRVGSLPSSEAEMFCPLEGRFATLERGGDDSPCSRVGSLPSSEAEMFFPLEGRFATLERGGDAGRSRGSREEPSSKAEIASRVRGGCEWAACWASLSPFLSFRLEGGRGPSWAQSPNICLRF